METCHCFVDVTCDDDDDDDGDDGDDDADGGDGCFLCSVLFAPVKNENNDVILFILNLEDITDAPVKTDVQRQTRG